MSEWNRYVTAVSARQLQTDLAYKDQTGKQQVAPSGHWQVEDVSGNRHIVEPQRFTKEYWPASGFLNEAKKGLQFQVYRDAQKQWRWRLVAANGRSVAASGEGYKRKVDCLHAIEIVRASKLAAIETVLRDHVE